MTSLVKSSSVVFVRNLASSERKNPARKHHQPPYQTNMRRGHPSSCSNEDQTPKTPPYTVYLTCTFITTTLPSGYPTPPAFEKKIRNTHVLILVLVDTKPLLLPQPERHRQMLEHPSYLARHSVGEHYIPCLAPPAFCSLELEIIHNNTKLRDREGRKQACKYSAHNVK